MNESELEDSLRALCPSAPSSGLEERIANRLAASRSSTVPAAGVIARRQGDWRRLWEGLVWACGGALAGVSLLLTVYPTVVTKVSTPAKPTALVAASPSLFEPAESAREVLTSEEAGTVYDSENQPSKLMRYTSVERHTWLNPSTGAQVAVEVPREDLVAIPATYQ